jgi:hypothetical protein
MKLNLAVGQIWEVEAPNSELFWKFQIVGKIIRRKRNCWIAVKSNVGVPGNMDMAVFGDRGILLRKDQYAHGIEWRLTELVHAPTVSLRRKGNKKDL